MANSKKDHNNLLWGAALAGVLGTLTSILMPKNTRRRGWVNQAKDAANNMVDGVRQWSPEVETSTRDLLLGGVAGGVVGVATALLLAPKSGKELIKDMAEPFMGSDTTTHRRTSSRSKAKTARSHAKKAKTERSSKEASSRAKARGGSRKKKGNTSHDNEKQTSAHVREDKETTAAST
jgi:gas vesicle protein